MAAANRDVVVLSGHGASDSINGLMRCISGLLSQHGCRVHYVDVAQADGTELSRLVSMLVGGSVGFAVSFGGIGHELQLTVGDSKEPVNAWDYAGVPLIKLHGDTPAYFLERHGDTPVTGVNAYYYEEHRAFRRWIFPEAASLAAGIDPFLISDTPTDRIDFAARERGTLVFVKNGGDPRELMTLWAQALPESISDDLIALALDIRKPAMESGSFHIHDYVIDHLAAKAIEPQQLRRTVRLYTAQLDDYVRRVKSTLVAQALLRFPVVIRGAGWDHLDRSSARAQIAPPLDFAATEAVFQNELGVVDMTPNVDGCGHDRMLRAAGCYAFGLCNRTTWLAELAPELNARGYDFTPESVAAAAEYALAHRSECMSLAQEYGRAFRRRYDGERWVERLVALSDLARLESGRRKPVLQPFFVW